ncbi:MAG: metalloregulator ArsR/SmtB family transcription factor [Planctomycetota bacterium]|nr:metalloregulator ArsR/SmtB family transcription factor [Planctomycetota bacterium]
MARMNRRTKARLEARARIIKAMAHPTRLFIVEELSRGERCVCELTEMIGADVSTVSKHLANLKAVGIIRDEKRGAQVFYTLHTPCVLNFMSCVERVLATSAKEQMHWAK